MGRTAAIFLLMALGWLIAGTMFRLMHWPMAGGLHIAAAVCLAIGLLLLLVAVIRNKGLTGLLDPPDRNDKGGH
jgi:hypothetical protein